MLIRHRSPPLAALLLALALPLACSDSPTEPPTAAATATGEQTSIDSTPTTTATGSGSTPTASATPLGPTPTATATLPGPTPTATATLPGATPTAPGPTATATSAAPTQTNPDATGSPGAPTTPPGGPTATPGGPTATPGGPTATPGGPTATPGGPTATPGGPTATPGGPSPSPSPTPTSGDADRDGYTVADGDCDDDDPTLNPGAADLPYDGIDQDCSGADLTDVDQDSYDSIEVSGGTDCDDDDPNTFPGAAEFEDDADNDCDGSVDEGLDTTDDDNDGYSESEGDCDDDDPDTHPGAEDIPYDGEDQDCSGADLTDVDGDGFRSTEVPGGTDCDDADPAVNPDADEVCDEVDNNCDQVVDTDAVDRGTYHPDADRDTYGATAVVLACAASPGIVEDATDCNDLDRYSYPGAPETCDGRDNDCDTVADEGVTTTWYPDGDGDGVGTAEGAQQACLRPDGHVATAGDCDDDDPAVHPGASERCDGEDDDCDTEVDEGATSTFYPDVDQDGFGDATAPTAACELPEGHVIDATDCDDGAPAVHPGADELCNNLDDDCDRVTDEGVRSTWYLDADGDEYGGPSAFTSCEPPDGYTGQGGDCDDDDVHTFPGASEQCDGDDNDCDGVAVPSAPLTAANDGPTCPGGDIALQASSITGATYSWTGPGGYTSTAQSPTLADVGAEDVGAYTVTASVAGCTFEKSTAVEITTTDASFSGPTSGYTGASVGFTATEADAQYAWTFEGGTPTTSTDNSPTVVWGDEGTYTVGLTVTADGCSGTSSQTITILDSFPSCDSLKTANPALTSGVYEIDPDLDGPVSPFSVYCDMSQDGGGWTLALNINTADGTISTLNMPVWTTTSEYGSFSDRFSTDYKSLAAETVTGTELLLIVRDAASAEGSTPVGWRSWYLDGSKKVNDFFSVAMGGISANASGGCNAGWSGDGHKQTTGIKSAGVTAPYDPFTTIAEDVYTNSYYGGCDNDHSDGFRMSSWYRWANNSNVGLGLQMDSDSQGRYSLEAGAHLKIETYTNPQRFCPASNCNNCTADVEGINHSTSTKVAIGTDHYDYHCSVGVNYRFEWYVK